MLNSLGKLKSITLTWPTGGTAARRRSARQRAIRRSAAHVGCDGDGVPVVLLEPFDHVVERVKILFPVAMFSVLLEMCFILFVR